MTDYISKEAVTTLFARGCGECKETCEEFDGIYADCNQCLLHGVLKAFANIPAADVEEVVRCKNCKHYKDGMCFNPNTYDDEKTCGNTTPEWFCADGARMEEQT